MNEKALKTLEYTKIIDQLTESLKLGRDLGGEVLEKGLAPHEELVPHYIVPAAKLDEEIFRHPTDGHPLAVDLAQLILVAAPALTAVG